MIYKTPKVALLIETSRGYGRGLLRGIMKYSRLFGPWQFHLTPGDFEQIVPRMSDWGGDGIIARVLDERTAQLVMKARLPAVFLDLPETPSIRKWGKRVPFIEMASDSVGAAKMAADYLVEKQFQQFAYAGYYGQVWSTIREKTFVDSIKNMGFDVHVYHAPTQRNKPLRWEKEEPYLAQWLTALPKPIALLACNDQRGREVLEACELAKIAVPEEIAVIGVDNDELICELSYPPLSSISLNAVQGGFLAAKALDEMMQKRPSPFKRIVVEPLDVVERRSTEVVAIDDSEIAAALQFIHTQSPNMLTIESIVNHIAVSRRSLEIRFRKRLGRTILQEIQKVRLDRAKQLLRETDLPIPKVASVSGFTTGSYLVHVFSKEIGMTPAKYRQKTHKV